MTRTSAIRSFRLVLEVVAEHLVIVKNAVFFLEIRIFSLRNPTKLQHFKNLLGNVQVLLKQDLVAGFISNVS